VCQDDVDRLALTIETDESRSLLEMQAYTYYIEHCDCCYHLVFI